MDEARDIELCNIFHFVCCMICIILRDAFNILKCIEKDMVNLDKILLLVFNKMGLQLEWERLSRSNVLDYDKVLY